MTVLSPTVLFVVSLLAILYVWLRRRQDSNLPPGPPRLPILGNLHQAPKEAVWVTYQKWVEQYGPLVYLNFAGTNVILIGDHEVAKDLLDKKAMIYSSRPRMVMAQELTCKSKHIMFKPFDGDFLLHQRLEAPVLSPRASACYTAIQDLESKQLLKNLLQSNDFPKEFERFAASIVYSITFGMRIITGDEWQLQTSHECLKNFTIAGQVGAWIVDLFPSLNSLPAPLTPWKKTAEAWYQMWENLHMANMEDALKRKGWNWAKEFNKSKEAKDLAATEVAWDLGVLCDAGVETTQIQLQIFILACVAYPGWIAAAQKELDEVVGTNRLPGFEDLSNLPYLQAVVEENFRWRHIVPAGIPHATTQDDFYKGYLIPKGSVVVPVFAAMRQNSSTFDSPEVFRPERWIEKSQPSNFGYGRRVCPGRFIARNSLAIAMARLLWAFNIRSKDGVRINVSEEMFTTGFVSGPKPFVAVFEPRSKERRNLIEREFDMADKNVAHLLDEARGKQIATGLSPQG
ncbi:cytochrome P450 [Alternaria alternata]|nr:cytochrome P450 [Alternaria alternata]